MATTKDENAAPEAQEVQAEQQEAQEVQAEVSAETTPEEVKKYEIMLILVPDLTKAQIDKELKTIRKFITDHKGEIYHEDDWGIRDLAYVIKKQTQGYYVIFYFTFDASATLEFGKILKLNQNIIRHMIVKSPRGYEIKKLEELVAAPEKEEQVKEEMKQKKVAIAVKKAEPEPKKETEKVVAEAPKPEKAEEKPVEPEAVESEDKPKPTVETEPEAPEPEKAEEKPEKKKEEEKKPLDISDLDSQLDKILDDPDLNLS